MVDSFKAEVFQNQYLPKGAEEVHAIMTVTAMSSGATQDVRAPLAGGGRLFGIICDISGSMEGEKLVSASAWRGRGSHSLSDGGRDSGGQSPGNHENPRCEGVGCYGDLQMVDGRA